jgi:putative ABC transport system permease protein
MVREMLVATSGEICGGEMMRSFLTDLRISLRMLLKAPVFTTVAILTLALGVGANTAVFSFVSATLLRALPLPEPERIVVLGEYNPGKNTPHTTVSPRNLEDWQRQSQTLEHFGQWRDWHGFRLATQNGTESIACAIASPDFFKALGVKPVLGRTFLPEENQPGHDQVVVLSYSFWQSYLRGDQSVIGKSITLDKKGFTIVGVLPAEMEALNVGSWKIWAPVSIDPDQSLGRHRRNRQVYARLKPNVTLEAAQAEMNSIAGRLAEQYPTENAGWRVSVTRLQDNEVKGIRPALLIFLGATALVLLIACANVANLMLARSAARRKEFAIRLSLGAGRLQVVRQLLTESVLLALLGGAAGLLLAFWLVDFFVAISPIDLPGNVQVRLDGKVLGFTFILSALTGILFGLAPALASLKLNLLEELKDGVKGSQSGRLFRLREVLVIMQVTVAVTLLIGAGLLSRTFLSLTRMQPGYNPENLLTVALSLPDEKYQKKSQVIAFYQQTREALESIPGIESVGSVSAGPQFGGHEPVEWMAEGQAPSASGEYQQARFYDVGPGYFHTLQIPLLRGREFTTQDNEFSPQVAIINETLARRYWPQGDAIGKRLLLPRSKQSLEIVGISGDVRRFNLDSQVEPEIYWPYLQKPRWATYFVLRANQDPAGFVAAVRSRVSQIDPEVLVSRASTMDSLINRSLNRPRFNMALLGIFAGTALILASVGLYGVISYSVTQRTREMGIRLALGAQPRDVLRMIIRETLTLVFFGVVLGLLVARLASQVLTAMLFEVKATDPFTYMLITVLVVCVAALAGYIPASRASRVDPMAALRYE